MFKNQLFVLTILLLSVVSVFACSPGSYLNSNGNYEHPCSECWYGTYCPGDNKAHKCPESTISTTFGATSCTRCPGLSNDARTVCLAVDLPADSREIKHGDVIHVESKRPYYYISVTTDNYDATLGSELTFINNVKGYQNSPIIAYSSLVTGQPGKENSMFIGKGLNSTIYAPNLMQSPRVYIVYLNIVPLIGDSIPVTVSVYSYLSKFITMDSPTFKQQLDISAHKNHAFNTLQFSYNVPSNSRVNFTIDVQSTLSSLASDFTLYHSTLQTVSYPNPSNANVVVHSSNVNFKAPVTLVANQVEGGPFIVAMEYHSFLKGVVNAHFQITPNKN